MTVGVDARLLGTGRGIGNVLGALLTEFAAMDLAEQFILYTPPGGQSVAASAFPRFQTRELQTSFFPLYEQVALPRQARLDGCDVLYCPANTAPLRSPVPVVVHLHDLIFLKDLPDPAGLRTRYQKLGRTYSRFVVPRAARRATRVLTISEFSRQDIASTLGIAAERIGVAPNALTDRADAIETECARPIVEALGVKGAYVLTLGASDPRKNIDVVLRAFASLPDLFLVIAGCQPSAARAFTARASELGLANRVRVLEFVERTQLQALYRCADAFVFPSLMEGFGLPILEALAQETRVVSSNAGPMPEVGGEAATYFDPRDPSSLGAALTQALAQPPRPGAEQLARFSWRRSAEVVLQALREAAR